MGKIQYPFPLFEVEENEDTSISFSCYYESFNTALSSLDPNVTNEKSPMVFVGVTEKISQVKQNDSLIVLPKLLEAVCKKLGSNYCESALISATELITTPGKRQTIWLWCPPIPTVFHEDEEPVNGYVCLVSWLSSHVVNKNCSTLSQLGAQCMLLSISSRICEISKRKIPENGLYDCLTYLNEIDYTSCIKSIPESFIHVVTGTEAFNAHLHGKGLPGCKVMPSRSRKKGYNTVQIAEELGDMEKIPTKTVKIKNCPTSVTLTVSNAKEFLHHCIATANLKIFDSYPKNVVSFFEREDYCDDLESEDEQQEENDDEFQEISEENNNMEKDPPSHQLYLTTLSTVVEGTLDTWTKNIQELHDISGLEESLKESFLDELSKLDDNDLKNPIAQFMVGVQNAVKEYVTEMTAQFEQHGYFSAENLISLHESIVTKTIPENFLSDPTAETSFRKACEQIYLIVKKHNEGIIKHQAKLLCEVSTDVENLYEKQLCRYRSENGPFTTVVFPKICQALFIRCMKAFTQSSEYKTQPINSNVFKPELDDLASRLKKIAAKQSKINKAEELEQQMKLTENLHNADKCQQIVPCSSQNVISTSTFNHSKENETSSFPEQVLITGKTFTTLQPEDAPENVIAQIHLQNCRQQLKLIPCTMESIVDLVEVMRRSKQLFRQEMEQKGLKSVTKIIWQTRIHVEFQKNLHANTKRRNDVSKDILHSSNKLKGLRKNEEISVFHITKELISVATKLIGNPGDSTHNLFATQAPNIVGQTHDGTLVYGNEAKKQEGSGLLRAKWDVGKIIEDANTNMFEVMDNHNNKLVRIEFLLGFILQQLRDETDSQDIKRCIICLPYYYTTMQRSQVINSSRVAGYVSTQLVNDTTAIAYEFAQYHYMGLKPELTLILTARSTENICVDLYSNTLVLQKGYLRQRMIMQAHFASSTHVDDVSNKYVTDMLANVKVGPEKRHKLERIFGLIVKAILQYHDGIHPKHCERKLNCVDGLLKLAFSNTVMVAKVPFKDEMLHIVSKIWGENIQTATNETAICGASHLSIQKWKQMIHSIYDLPSSALFVETGGNFYELGKSLVSRQYPLRFSVISHSKTTSFYQKLMTQTGLEVMRLDTNCSMDPTFPSESKRKLQIQFYLNKNGIFCVSDVKLLDSNTNEIIRTLTPKIDYEQKELILKKHELRRYKRQILGSSKFDNPLEGRIPNEVPQSNVDDVLQALGQNQGPNELNKERQEYQGISKQVEEMIDDTGHEGQKSVQTDQLDTKRPLEDGEEFVGEKLGHGEPQGYGGKQGFGGKQGLAEQLGKRGNQGHVGSKSEGRQDDGERQGVWEQLGGIRKQDDEVQGDGGQGDGGQGDGGQGDGGQGDGGQGDGGEVDDGQGDRGQQDAGEHSEGSGQTGSVAFKNTSTSDLFEENSYKTSHESNLSITRTVDSTQEIPVTYDYLAGLTKRLIEKLSANYKEKMNKCKACTPENFEGLHAIHMQDLLEKFDKEVLFPKDTHTYLVYRDILKEGIQLTFNTLQTARTENNKANSAASINELG